MKGSERQAFLFFILVVACIVTAIFAGSGLLLAESFGIGFVYGLCFVTEPKLLFVLLLMNSILSQEAKNKPGGGPPLVSSGWLGFLTAIMIGVGVLVCFVFGLVVGAQVGDWLKHWQSQQ